MPLSPTPIAPETLSRTSTLVKPPLTGGFSVVPLPLARRYGRPAATVLWALYRMTDGLEFVNRKRRWYLKRGRRCIVQSIRQLMEKTGYCRSTVMRALRTLREAGFLRWHYRGGWFNRRTGLMGRRPNEYVVDHTKIDGLARAILEDNPHSGPDSGHKGQEAEELSSLRAHSETPFPHNQTQATEEPDLSWWDVGRVRLEYALRRSRERLLGDATEVA